MIVGWNESITNRDRRPGLTETEFVKNSFQVMEGDVGKVVVTRQDRVVIYQMEEREVEHTWQLDLTTKDMLYSKNT